jgi:hypothetical protein
VVFVVEAGAGVEWVAFDENAADGVERLKVFFLSCFMQILIREIQ